VMGNVTREDAEAIYFREASQAHRKHIRDEQCPTCLSPCQMNVAAIKQVVPYARFLVRASMERRRPGSTIHRVRGNRSFCYAGLLAGGHGQRPEPRRRILRPGRAQEDHPGAVGADRHGVRRAVAEMAGAIGERGVVHASSIADQGRTPPRKLPARLRKGGPAPA